MGDRIQVRTAQGDHPDRQDRRIGRPHGCAHAGRAAAAGRGRWGDRVEGVASQPRRARAQGCARRGPGARTARRRRDPPGRGAGRRGGAGAGRALCHARPLPVVWHRARTEGALHRLPESLRLQGAVEGADHPLRFAERPGHRGTGRGDRISAGGPGTGEGTGRPLRPGGGGPDLTGGICRTVGPQPHCRDSGGESRRSRR